MNNTEAPSSACCSTSSSTPPVASAELKLYQAFIFSVPIFFSFILLFLFYLFYLRRGRVDWASLRMRSSSQEDPNNIAVQAELGLKKEVRDMLPIIVYKESFSVRDTLCSVCLGDYQAEDQLQQIPACGHTFHMDCIDSWLANHTTCPLCRLSILASAKALVESPIVLAETSQLSYSAQNDDGTSVEPMFQASEETLGARLSALSYVDSRTEQSHPEEGGRRRSQHVDQGRDSWDAARIEIEERECGRGMSCSL